MLYRSFFSDCPIINDIDFIFLNSTDVGLLMIPEPGIFHLLSAFGFLLNLQDKKTVREPLNTLGSYSAKE